jgi:hypothetical protein
MLYPVKFQPYLKFCPYGGQRFAEMLKKEGVPRDRDVAESWEIADHGQEQPVVAGQNERSVYLPEGECSTTGAESAIKVGNISQSLFHWSTFRSVSRPARCCHWRSRRCTRMIPPVGN